MISQNLSSASVVIGALRVNVLRFLSLGADKEVKTNTAGGRGAV